jgi:hypothetical protein
MRKQDYHISDLEDRINREARNCEGWRDGAWALESRDADVPLQGHAQRQALILAHAPLRRVGRGLHEDARGAAELLAVGIDSTLRHFFEFAGSGNEGVVGGAVYK